MGPIRDVTHAAQAMEACLLRQLIETSGAFRGSSGTAGGQIHAQMFVEALADAVEKGGGIGLARLIEKSLPAAQGDEPTQASDEVASSALNVHQSRADLPISSRPQATGDWP